MPVPMGPVLPSSASESKDFDMSGMPGNVSANVEKKTELEETQDAVQETSEESDEEEMEGTVANFQGELVSPEPREDLVSEFPDVVSALSLDQLQKLQELVTEQLEDEKATGDIPAEPPALSPTDQFMWSEF